MESLLVPADDYYMQMCFILSTLFFEFQLLLLTVLEFQDVHMTHTGLLVAICN